MENEAEFLQNFIFLPAYTNGRPTLKRKEWFFKTGIYIIVAYGEILYVGMSNHSLYQRIYRHFHKQITVKKYSRIYQDVFFEKETQKFWFVQCQQITH